MKYPIILIAALLATTSVPAEACMLTIYPKEDASPEARAYRLYPYISAETCRKRPEAIERFRAEDELKKSGTSSMCMTTITGDTIITRCK